MPQTWEFANVGADCTPEIVIKATNPITSGEKVLLFQVLNGCFGRPVILSGTSVNGQASELVIGFGDTAIGDQSLEINKNYDNLSVIPYWHPDEFIISNVRNIYADDTNVGDRLFIMLSKRQKLFFKINDFDLIKDYNPKIIVERYVGSKTRGINGQRSGAAYRLAPRKNTVSITSNLAEIDFKQEEMFRIEEGGRIRAKSYKITNVFNAHAYFHFRMQLTVNGTTLISNPVVRLKLQASLKYNGIKASKVDEIRTKATAKKASTEVEAQQLRNQIEESASDVEIESLRVKLSKIDLELQEAQALIDATERIPGNPDNPQLDTRYYAISYRIV